MKILFVINGLNVGGAERMLARLVREPIFADDEVTVVSLMPSAKLSAIVAPAVHRLIHLDVTKSPAGLLRLWRLFGVMRQVKPDLVHSWLYQSDLAAGIAARICGVSNVVWSIRQSNLSAQHNRLTTRLAFRLCATLSGVIPDLILSNAESGRQSHVDIGYKRDRIEVIPNGVDFDEFKRDHRLGRDLRRRLGISSKVKIVGKIARFDSQKNHFGFFQVAKRIFDERDDVEFVLCGKGMTTANKALMKMVTQNNLTDRVHLLGERQDLPAIYSMLDTMVLFSDGEAFPMVLLEAVASGTTCVSTAAGDAGTILLDKKNIVSIGDVDSCANRVLSLLACSEMERREMAAVQRSYAKARFDLSRVAEKFRASYETLISRSSRQS